MTQLLPPKKDVALALLERSNVDVYLDPRSKGVVVPPQFRKEPRLILKIGLNMPVPIPDLRLDDESMSCTLSFNRSPFFCVVPWPSVFAMVGEDGRGMVWPDDVPQELAVKAVDDKKGPREREPAAATPSPRARRGTREGRDVKTEAREEPREGGSRAARREGKEPSAAVQKKAKKKKDEGRPVLVAVPASVESAPRPSKRTAGVHEPTAIDPRRSISTAGDAGDGAEVDADANRLSAVPPSRRPIPSPQRDPRQRDPSRPKRELPPYLRVVK